MNKWIIGILLLGIILWTTPALADTTYNPQGATTVRDGDFVKMGRVVVTGTTTLTFTGNDQVEFRLPPDFYITSTGYYDQNGGSAGVVLRVVQGFDDPSAVLIRPIAEDRYNPGRYGGFELTVKTKSGSDGHKPELMLYFDHVYVPPGASGNVEVTAEQGESSGFSDGKSIIAKVETAKLSLKVEKEPFLATDQRVGPVLISENMGGAFDYVELALPQGYTWHAATASVDPGLGLVRDYDGDGAEERDFKLSEYSDKYGSSVLRVERLGAKSTARGTLRVECYVEVDDDSASAGDVRISVSGSSNPDVSTLKVGTYNTRSITVSYSTASQLYGGLRDQLIGDITIKENAPNTLAGGSRTVTLELPAWAKWANEPRVQLSGTSELELGLKGGRAYATGSDGKFLRFNINNPSLNRPATIVIKEAKINLPLDADGELQVKVSGNAGASGEVTVGKVNPPLTATAVSKPVLTPGLKGQRAGDLELAEAAGRILLAGELWLDFPSEVIPDGTPNVQVNTGNLKIGAPTVGLNGNTYRMTIPIETSGSTAATLRITGIIYDITRMAPDGDVVVRISGPAINELTNNGSVLFPGRDDTIAVTNASIAKGEGTPTPTVRNVSFRLADNTYQVNGQSHHLDAPPYSENGRTFLPLRYAGLALGVEPDNILWDSNKKLATLIKDDLMVQVTVGEAAVYRAGVRIPTDAAAHLREGRVMVPMRAVATAFGAEVNWNQVTRTVSIKL